MNISKTEFADKEDAPKGIRDTVDTGPANPKGVKGRKHAIIYMCRQKDSLVMVKSMVEWKTTSMTIKTIRIPVINAILNQPVTVIWKRTQGHKLQMEVL